jgi:hypothetical protein
MIKQLLMELAVKQRQKRMQVNHDFDVEDYLNRIPLFFDEKKAETAKLTVVYEFHDSGKNNGAWTITIKDGKCLLTKGCAEVFDTKLYMNTDTYRRILTGRLDITRLAYSTGAIRYYGNTLGHRELNYYLSFPKKADVAAL